MANELPFLSVIIPTYNRPHKLGLCLDALSRLDYSLKRFEVVVVDDGGSAPLDETVARFDGFLDVKLIVHKNAGPAGARNFGAGFAKGKFLVFIDDDCTADPGWLKALAGRASKEPGAIVGGTVENAFPEDIYANASQLLLSYLREYFSGDAGMKKELYFFTTNNMCVEAGFFKALGGFDAGLRTAEDRDFCLRSRAAGNKLAYEPSATVYHAHRMGFSNFCRQHFKYGRGARYFHDKRKGMSKGRVRIEPLSFYSGMLAYPFKRETSLRALSSAFLLMASQAVYLAGFLFERFFPAAGAGRKR